ncbi:unnamed protein product [Rangifer tarandus platyrhynchus]|uniref:Uncharacterized protein n=1 Tax=Rangifer tarandus platyrhynchus TaxID=3082113 RepID=A0ABN8ZSU7_RANTA|nr:unnamed protein product [Rangifer tarandus platyrhynchus]
MPETSAFLFESNRPGFPTPKPHLPQPGAFPAPRPRPRPPSRAHGTPPLPRPRPLHPSCGPAALAFAPYSEPPFPIEPPLTDCTPLPRHRGASRPSEPTGAVSVNQSILPSRPRPRPRGSLPPLLLTVPSPGPSSRAPFAPSPTTDSSPVSGWLSGSSGAGCKSRSGSGAACSTAAAQHSGHSAPAPPRLGPPTHGRRPGPAP